MNPDCQNQCGEQAKWSWKRSQALSKNKFKLSILLLAFFSCFFSLCFFLSSEDSMWLRMWNAKMATYTGPSSHGMHLSMYNNYMYQVTPRVFGCRMLQHEKSATSCLIGYKKIKKKSPLLLLFTFSQLSFMPGLLQLLS